MAEPSLGFTDFDELLGELPEPCTISASEDLLDGLLCWAESAATEPLVTQNCHAEATLAQKGLASLPKNGSKPGATAKPGAGAKPRATAKPDASDLAAASPPANRVTISSIK